MEILELPDSCIIFERPFSPGPGPFGAALHIAFLLCKESDSRARGRDDYNAQGEPTPSLGPLIIETPKAIFLAGADLASRAPRSGWSANPGETPAPALGRFAVGISWR